jgi:hypothetical protein
MAALFLSSSFLSAQEPILSFSRPVIRQAFKKAKEGGEPEKTE